MIRGLKPWFYSPYPSFKPLGTFADVVGLVCAIFQFVFATIVYVLLSANPIKISVWPVIFAIGVLFSRFPRKQQKISVLERIEIAQRTLDGLQPHEVAMLFEDENYNELSEILERGKKRAETARLRELHTLKGQVESKVKLKGLDVGIIQRQYSV
ncbi:hypothetical protein JCGZ_05050 [Jatropha curcas]|uniref:Uncharacterized protein n=2 Tax=Jatropha curcas TaxID=180498 RepID=A0A067KV82_JATCU|nr:hypothetical protein JCGZ_05050 [Jatropha curcas]